MLGSAADAEDVLQETWLRWVKVDVGRVRDQRAYLVRITTRQSLDRLRTMRRRREAYIGSWLPEPLLTAPDVAEDVELAESVSMALMLVLETLSPIERVVFVLRQAFDASYEEIAAAVEKSPAAVRQIAHRARQHVDAHRPREVASGRRDRRRPGDPCRGRPYHGPLLRPQPGEAGPRRIRDPAHPLRWRSQGLAGQCASTSGETNGAARAGYGTVL